MVDHYSVLGVSPDATYEQIKTAYTRLVLRAHPDKGGAHSKFVKIQAAYEVLRDATARATYDKERTRNLKQRRSSSSKNGGSHAHPYADFSSSMPSGCYDSNSFNFWNGRPDTNNAWNSNRESTCGSGYRPYSSDHGHPRPGSPEFDYTRAELERVNELQEDALKHLTRYRSMQEHLLQVTKTHHDLGPEIWAHLRHFDSRLANRELELRARAQAIELHQVPARRRTPHHNGIFARFDVDGYVRSVKTEDKQTLNELSSAMTRVITPLGEMKKRRHKARDSGMEVDNDDVKRELDESVALLKRFLIKVLSA